MQETWVIELVKEDATKVNWASFDANATLLKTELNAELTDIASHLQDRYVIILVPASDTLLLNIALPPMNKQRLAQALPYAIEEYLLDETHHLHIAPLFKEQSIEGDMPVLIVEQTKMQSWLELLKSVGISPDLMTSTFFAVPYHEHHISLWQDNLCLIRIDRYQGYLSDPENVLLLMSHLLKTKKFLQVDCFSLQQNDLALTALPQCNINIVQMSAADRLQKLATFILTEKPINLLQDRFLTRKVRLPKGLLMRTMLILTISWFTLLLAYPLISYTILKKQLMTLNQDITDIYKKYYPNTRNFNTARVQLEERMNQLTSSVNENKLLLQLGFLGEALQGSPNVMIKQLNFSDQKMELEVSARAAEEVTSFVEKLTEKGLQIVQQNANLSNDKVSVNLSVEGS